VANFLLTIGDARFALFSVQNDDEWFDNAPTGGVDDSLSQVATALYTTPFVTCNTRAKQKPKTPMTFNASSATSPPNLPGSHNQRRRNMR